MRHGPRQIPTDAVDTVTKDTGKARLMDNRNKASSGVDERGGRAWSRRSFVQSICVGGITFGGGARWLPGLRAADESEALPVGSRLIVRSAKPLNAEPPLDELMRDWLTPVGSFYIRNHGVTPHVDGAKFRLSVDGLVDRPIEL